MTLYNIGLFFKCITKPCMSKQRFKDKLFLLRNYHQDKASEDVKTRCLKLAGYPIHYLQVGTGPHVVFCFPGILGNTRIHTVSQIESFDRERFTFVTWDQPGYAKSSPPERVVHDGSLAEDTDIMLELMKILGFQNYSIMGWSWGGCSALLAAIKHPDIVKKLVIWGTFARVDQEDAHNFKYFSRPENISGKMEKFLKKNLAKSFLQSILGIG